MKTPWKFLAQLTSRRPSAKAQGSSIGNDTDSQALESEVENRWAPPPSSTVAASPPAHDEDVSVDRGAVASDKAKGDGGVAQALKLPIDAAEVQTNARHEADHSGAGANLVPKSAATKSPSKPRIKRRERGKRANAHLAAQSAVPPKPHQSVQPLSSRDLFFHEVATLDEEIEMLRTQLAQKLHLQNVQLKKMLERFEVS
ncbi:hypothetical protein N181_24760 [Sinorhizobium fredii USDA 205]|uniref:Uncharacterized protein n=1 Tax=Rhizobium fredii TaxID=380 RepID=A0A844AN72_RHIFR|nr:hypothetical protein [Sinorhizobium fredii]AWM29524.1 hypothetical protein AOX55_00006749 [Sinorhizobium fredii CCBAU 25509]KSV83885.1 hypothetical protein N181_24760 [Sinorhizobium fredii USDA 205]MCG5474267.1 hypothetical protein [Sinorhizobium fredii]MQW99526.1 hypothetical protein [Sinorhizobium fredii]MQX12505.1 hypothetical protein [Sinorhizobium fredii]